MTITQSVVLSETKQIKAIPRRRLINKVRHKVKKQNERLLQTYKSIEHEKKSSLHAMLQPEAVPEYDFDMLNHISMGQNRKLKKKLKKLNKKFGDDKDKVFKDLQKYKQAFYRQHEKTIFNPVNEMQVRRAKRMKKMLSNERRSKLEVFHKSQKVRNTNYKVVDTDKKKPNKK